LQPAVQWAGRDSLICVAFCSQTHPGQSTRSFVASQNRQAKSLQRKHFQGQISEWGDFLATIADSVELARMVPAQIQPERI
jgi:hypothetical protein